MQLSGMQITFNVDLTRTAQLSAEQRLECLCMPDCDKWLSPHVTVLFMYCSYKSDWKKVSRPTAVS